MNLRGFPGWEELYRVEKAEGLPWYYPALDPDFERAIAQHLERGARVLDLGTGPGTQAIELAKRGFRVVATDLSKTAIEGARARAAAAGVAIDFAVDDVLHTALEGPFDAVFDRGCFHTLDPDDRGTYVGSMVSVLSAEGLLILKCFSHEQIGTEGPHRFEPDALRAIFARSFDMLSIEPAVFQGTFEPNPKALFAVMRRR
jgi:cyclopropane fatty-acyl-phospholipid synthase-like methyltransferase